MTKTGQTNQFTVAKTEKIGNITYAPGTYASFNLNDALPGKPEFIVYCENSRSFVANNLNIALQMWADCGKPTVHRINRIG